MEYTYLPNLPTITVSHNEQIKKKVIIHNGTIPHLTNFAQAHFPPQQIAHSHSHDDMWEVFLIVSGKGKMKVKGQEFILKPGVCITVAPHETHEIINDGCEELIINYFGIAE